MRSTTTASPARSDWDSVQARRPAAAHASIQSLRLPSQRSLSANTAAAPGDAARSAATVAHSGPNDVREKVMSLPRTSSKGPCSAASVR